MRYKSWPDSILLSLLDEAQENGNAEAETDTPDNARKMRFALYNLRRTFAKDDARRTLTILINENRVTITRILSPSITIIESKADA